MRKVLLLLMILCLIFPTVSLADGDSYASKNELPPSIDALDSNKENQLLEEMGYLNSDGFIKLNKDEPIVIKFKDGSSIEYSIKENFSIFQEQNATVSKAYNYGIARVVVDITVFATLSGRSITINSATSQMRGYHYVKDSLNTDIIQANGYGNDFAKVRVDGEYTLTVPYQGSTLWSNNFILEAHADAAGSLYMKTIR